jgi:hypothetical protein
MESFTLMSTNPYFGDVPPVSSDTPTQPELQAIANPAIVATDVAPRPTNALDWRRLGLIGAIALVVIALIGGIALAARAVIGSQDATSTAQNYCDSAKSQQYTKAYGYFAAALQTTLTAAAYPVGAQAVDTIQGKVTACKLGKLTVAKDGKTATLAATVTRQKVGAQNFTWQFTQANGWRFSAAPDAAVLPLTLATRYCQDIQANKLADAYALFTNDEQTSVGPMSQFTQDLQQTSQFIGGLQKCQLQKITASKDGTTSAIKLGIWFANYQNVPAEIDVLSATDGTAKVNVVNIYAVGNAVPYPIPVTMLQQILQIFGGSTGSSTKG